MLPVTIKETKNGTHGVTRPTVTAYAVRRPDKQVALLAINKNPKRAAQLNVEFNLPGEKAAAEFCRPSSSHSILATAIRLA